MSQSYNYWAPWIGPNTRKEDTVLNTEYAKMHAPRPATEDAELEVTEERLEEVLTNLKVILFSFYTNKSIFWIFFLLRP